MHQWLTPLFLSWGWPQWSADVAGFVLALVIVTFLHLVVGEMAPKSWAIAHPERSATLLALPMRGFMWLTRPVLRSLNSMANGVLRRIGIEPSDQVATGQSPAALLHLVEHSANVGALDARYSTQLTSALELETLTVGELLGPDSRPTAVGGSSTARDVQQASLDSGHLRILVGDGGTAQGVVHVRDTLAVGPETPTTLLMRPVLHLDADTRVYTALKDMRQTRNHLAVVVEEGQVSGVVTLADLLRRLFPEADVVATA